jgi:hypothetical protein
MPKRGLIATAPIVLAVGLIVWVVGSGCGDEGFSPTVGEPEIVSMAQLREFAAGFGGPIYWLGERENTSYELTETSSGQVYIRYLDKGVEAGAGKAGFLAVGTYPSEDGVAALRRAARAENGAVLGRTDDGAVLLIDPGAGDNAHLAYPGGEVQIEVYSPKLGEALRLASRGDVQPVP